ncbi:MAG: AzlD domain-containing protein [Hyphomicrobiaceae bacterium]
MSTFSEGLFGLLGLVALAALVHEPWRWAGYALGRSLNPQDEIFKWVKFVSTSLIAALVARLMLFPSGALAQVGLEIRLAAVAAGVGVLLRYGKPWQGVCMAAAVIAVGKLWLSGP